MSQPAAVNASMSPVQWAMLITLSIVFGGSFFFNGVIVRDLPPLTIVFFRVALAAIALHLYLRATGRAMPWTGAVWRMFLAMGALNNVIPFTLIVYGQTQIASGVASILNAMTPLFTVVVAHYWTEDEKLTGARIAGVFAGLGGVAVMMGGATLGGGWGTVAAYLACLGAALAYGFAAVYGRRFRKAAIDPLAVATAQVTASSVMMLPLMLAVDRPWTLAMPGLDSVLALIGLAIVSTAFAYLLYFSILSGAGATNLSLVTFLVPVSAIILGIAFLDEVLLPRHMIGMALIGLGLALVDGRLFRRRIPPAP